MNYQTLGSSTVSILSSVVNYFVDEYNQSEDAIKTNAQQQKAIADQLKENEEADRAAKDATYGQQASEYEQRKKLTTYITVGVAGLLAVGFLFARR